METQITCFGGKMPDRPPTFVFTIANDENIV
jgi:hypothetical protein